LEKSDRPNGNADAAETEEQPMDKKEAPMKWGGLVIYSRAYCPYSWRAKRLLRSKGCDFEVVDATGDEELRAWLAEATGRGTMPQIFIDDTPLGGYDDIKALERSGELERLVGSA
jgi:glutaredoxin 3